MRKRSYAAGSQQLLSLVLRLRPISAMTDYRNQLDLKLEIDTREHRLRLDPRAMLVLGS